ncbi:hypothetical protein TRFO_24638 [Tritrichomonas foetus]|uniref:GOLD domain-containing protein n=1 Tax=Tritrichomonas foetus TaxID=1144522 RepID=A0A1J4K778_9EUKA|nr:hypothetical protein TRFO_24638 [Tritrichomonas foetus]|eukprot:OHT07239.1 hypothetical protein TRFO_24638 [Tritrichomonas foetus]
MWCFLSTFLVISCIHQDFDIIELKEKALQTSICLNISKRYSFVVFSKFSWSIINYGLVSTQTADKTYAIYFGEHTGILEIQAKANPESRIWFSAFHEACQTEIISNMPSLNGVSPPNKRKNTNFNNQARNACVFYFSPSQNANFSYEIEKKRKFSPKIEIINVNASEKSKLMKNDSKENQIVLNLPVLLKITGDVSFQLHSHELSTEKEDILDFRVDSETGKNEFQIIKPETLNLMSEDEIIAFLSDFFEKSLIILVSLLVIRFSVWYFLKNL